MLAAVALRSWEAMVANNMKPEPIISTTSLAYIISLVMSLVMNMVPASLPDLDTLEKIAARFQQNGRSRAEAIRDAWRWMDENGMGDSTK